MKVNLTGIFIRLDDIEDGSELRRGYPSTHSVFGVPQTINAGSFAIVDALTKASKMDIPNSLDITLGLCTSKRNSKD